MPAKPLNFKTFAGTPDHRLSPPHKRPGQFTRRRSQVRVLSRPPLSSYLIHYHQTGAHELQNLGRARRKPNNPGIAARAKDLREQFLL